MKTLLLSLMLITLVGCNDKIVPEENPCNSKIQFFTIDSLGNTKKHSTYNPCTEEWKLYKDGR